MIERYLDQLCRYMNYEVRPHEKQWRVLVHHHRAVMPAIWAANQDKLFSSPPLLFRIDAHDDYVEEKVNYATEAATINTLDDCLLFANRLRADNGGWVEAAVKLGWVGDVVTFFVQSPGKGLRDWHIEVSDIAGKKHNLFSIGGFGDNGELNDVAQADHWQALHAALGWKPGKGWTWTAADAPEIWFDLDLDFAVHNLGDFGRMPWRRKDFEKELDDRTLGSLVPVLYAAKLLTIATEPEFSCGFSGVAIILAALQRCFGGYGDWFAWDEM